MTNDSGFYSMKVNGGRPSDWGTCQTQCYIILINACAITFSDIQIKHHYNNQNPYHLTVEVNHNTPMNKVLSHYYQSMHAPEISTKYRLYFKKNQKATVYITTISDCLHLWYTVRAKTRFANA